MKPLRKIKFWHALEGVVVLAVSYVVGMAANLIWICRHMYEADPPPTPHEYAALSLWWGLVAVFPVWLVLRGLSDFLVGSFGKR